MACSLRVYTEEVSLVDTFRHTCSMNDIVKGMTAELLLQLLFGVEVEVDEMDAFVLQVTPRTTLAHACPHLHSSGQSQATQQTADG